MAIIAQSTTLWAASSAGHEVRAGRVIGWDVEPAQPVPMVAWCDETGLLYRVGPPLGAAVWLADTRGEAIESAQREARAATV